MASSAAPVTLTKPLYTDITRLKLLDRDNAEVKFRLKDSPFKDDEDEEELIGRNREDYVITGQVFPKSDIYRERSYMIEMKLTKKFPIDPPEVRFLTPIYHPNVEKDGTPKTDIWLRNKNIFLGKFCNALLVKTAKWTARTPLTEVVKAVVDHIDHPDIDYSASVG